MNLRKMLVQIVEAEEHKELENSQNDKANEELNYAEQERAEKELHDLYPRAMTGNNHLLAEILEPMKKAAAEAHALCQGIEQESLRRHIRRTAVLMFKKAGILLEAWGETDEKPETKEEGAPLCGK